MLKKTITYENYNGVTETEDFYFNLTKVECTELEFSVGPGKRLSDFVQTIVNSQDIGEILSTLKKIILMSYGEKSADGKRFVKRDELRLAFEQSPAFEVLYWELLNSPEKASDFIVGIIPSDMRNSLGDNPKQALLDRTNALKNNSK